MRPTKTDQKSSTMVRNNDNVSSVVAVGKCKSRKFQLTNSVKFWSFYSSFELIIFLWSLNPIVHILKGGGFCCDLKMVKKLQEVSHTFSTFNFLNWWASRTEIPNQPTSASFLWRLDFIRIKMWCVPAQGQTKFPLSTQDTVIMV